MITYTANGAQKVAVAAGLASIAWPTEVVTGTIVILSLDEVAAIPSALDATQVRALWAAGIGNGTGPTPTTTTPSPEPRPGSASR